MGISNDGEKSEMNGILIVIAGGVQILRSEEHLLGKKVKPTARNR